MLSAEQITKPDKCFFLNLHYMVLVNKNSAKKLVGNKKMLMDSILWRQIPIKIEKIAELSGLCLSGYKRNVNWWCETTTIMSLNKCISLVIFQINKTKNKKRPKWDVFFSTDQMTIRLEFVSVSLLVESSYYRVE